MILFKFKTFINILHVSKEKMLEEIDVNEKTTEKRRYEVNGNKALHRKLSS